MHTRFMWVSVGIFLASIVLSAVIYLFAVYLGDVSLGNAAEHASLVPGALAILLGVIAIYFYLRLEDPEMLAARDARAQMLRVKAHATAALFALEPARRMCTDQAAARDAVLTISTRIRDMSIDERFWDYARSSADFANFEASSREQEAAACAEFIRRNIGEREAGESDGDVAPASDACDGKPSGC